MTERALMALFDRWCRLYLPSGYWVQKDSEDRWQIGCDDMFLGFSIASNMPVGRGGSMDYEIALFVDMMNGRASPATDQTLIEDQHP